jgi:hypothetical protein
MEVMCVLGRRAALRVQRTASGQLRLSARRFSITSSLRNSFS